MDVTAWFPRGGSLDKIIVEGGHPLNGQVTISGAKNAVLPVLAATLLTHGKSEIQAVPGVRDVTTMVRLVQELGTRSTISKGTAWSWMPLGSIIR